jgi:hypothetical protein
MISDDGRRWRALRGGFDAFPPDEQDMGAFLDWVDTLSVLIERHERLDPQASGPGTCGDGPRGGSSP